MSMESSLLNPTRIIAGKLKTLSRKSKKIGEFILANPGKIAVMTTRKLAAECDASEATVVRFVQGIGYAGYHDFLDALMAENNFQASGQDIRQSVDYNENDTPPKARFKKSINTGINELHALADHMNMESVGHVLELINKSKKIFIIGSFNSYSLACSLGWMLQEIRPGVEILKVGGHNCITTLADAPERSLVIILGLEPYPDNLFRIASSVSGLNIPLVVISDLSPCPMARYALVHLQCISRVEQGFSSNVSMVLLFQFMIGELAIHDANATQEYQAKLHKARRGNYLYFNQPEWLRIGRWEDITTLDPAWMSSASRELTIMTCIYDGLVRYKEGTWDTQPNLARSWDVSSDGREIIFYLCKGVMFHRGYGEMTSEDVRFSFERIIDKKSTSPYKSMWDVLDSVQKISRYIVKINLKYSCPALFTSILPSNAGMIVSHRAVTEMGHHNFAFNPVGTGPYQFKLFAPGDRIELERFKGFKGTKPFVSQLVFCPKNDKNLLEQDMINGDLDVLQLPFVNTKSIKNMSDFNVKVLPGQQIWWLGMMANKAPFDILEVRQSIRYALDVDKMIYKAFYGYAKRANSFLPPGLIGYWNDAPVRQQDFSKAKKLLKKAGFENGLKVKLLIVPSRIDRVVSEIIKEDLKKIGIIVDIDIRDVNACNDAAMRGECDLYLANFSFTTDSDYLAKWFRSDQAWNLSHFKNPEYDKVITKAAFEMNLKKREELYLQAQAIVDEDCWAIWLTHGASIVASHKKVDVGSIFPNGSLAPWTIKKFFGAELSSS
ncbi:MAG: SIS domain-containing protein [Desulfobacteraceae bacterium]|nr:SIS domain-containing protein [Desulfobacteraceae bacterium]